MYEGYDVLWMDRMGGWMGGWNNGRMMYLYGMDCTVYMSKRLSCIYSIRFLFFFSSSSFHFFLFLLVFLFIPFLLGYNNMEQGFFFSRFYESHLLMHQ